MPRASSGRSAEKVKRWKVGDEVVIHCNQDDGDDEECNGGDPMFSPSQRIWGYETPDGSFAQFTRVQAQQVMPRPQAPDLGRERLLYPDPGDRLPHAVRASAAYPAPRSQRAGLGRLGRPGVHGDPACATAGANAIGVISDMEKEEFVMSLGAKGVINRNDFDCWGRLPDVGSEEGYGAVHEEGAASSARRSGRSPARATTSISSSSIRAKQTFPVSCFVVKRGGMVVFCAGTTGYNLTFDARFVWMRQKRIQGSHFANLKQASQANQLVIERRIDPCMSEVFSWDDIPRAHMKMRATSTSPATWRFWCSRQAPRACARSKTKASRRRRDTMADS